MSGGYENTPIIKSISLLSLIISIAIRPDGSDIFQLLRGNIIGFLLSTISFHSPAETIIGLILLYTLRQFERQLGIKKFCTFLLFSYIVSLLIQLALVALAMQADIYIRPSPGPYYLIYSLLILYYHYIPKIYSTQYSIMGMQVSEKSWTYVLAAQLLLCDGVYSIIPAVSGLIAGYAYQIDVIGIQGLRFPRPVEYVFELIGQFISILAGDNRNNNNNNNNNTRNSNMRVGDRPGDIFNMNDLNQYQDFNSLQDNNTTNSERNTIMPIVEPTEEAIETLMGMGFDREAVVNVLRRTGNNVEAAANMLLR